ncbi:hypothetical protein VTN02DRAFT_6303 [Thermoascus thermophilus]
MIDSVILVSVRSLFAGRKFFTPEISESKLAPSAPDVMRSVSRFESDEKPRNRSEDCCCGALVDALVIIVIRVISRTRLTYASAVVSWTPARVSASSNWAISGRDSSVSVLRNQMMNSRSLSVGSLPLSGSLMSSIICVLLCLAMFSSSWKKLSS